MLACGFAYQAGAQMQAAPVPYQQMAEERAAPELQPGQHAVQSGTGFYVSNTGHIITNEHVVRGCEQVMLRGTMQPTSAKVLATNAKFDLALLQSQRRPSRIASLRTNDETMMVEDPVMVMGYPLDSGVSGQYVVNLSKITGLSGPQNEPHWLQFADAALQGNSGGPLLDASGNVIGVIVGKTKLSHIDPQSGKKTVVSEADVALNLAVLREFLKLNNVYFRSRDSRNYYSINRVENQARQYVMNIHCLPGQ